MIAERVMKSQLGTYALLGTTIILKQRNVNQIAQTVETKTANDILGDIDKILKCMAYDRKLQKHYDVGEGYDKNEAFELIRLQELLCTPHCDIAKHKTKIKNLIKQKIAKYGL